ncbi:flagellar hook-length control protein FliK [Alteromonas gracilis]|uniref:flagellar hook-length control protein FliK n=1 Tax=Alteromonas gracilis TaxID=1479524 RepID=UPI0037354285
MQQVAAQKTDIAALPFSASSTAKAVETGIGAQQSANSENNQAFNRLYQEAKSSKSDFVLGDSDSRDTHTPTKNQESGKSVASSSNYAAAEKDPEPGHSHLPGNGESSDVPDDTSNTANSQNNERHEINGDEDLAAAEVDEGHAKSEQRGMTEKGFVVGEGTKKAPETDIITVPGSPDAKPDKGDSSEPDWIAFVETVTNRLSSDASTVASPRHANTGETSNNGFNEIIAGEAAEVISVKEAGKLWKLPDHVDASDAPSVLTHFLSQLNSESDAESVSLESLSDEAQQTLSALTALLFGENAESEYNETNKSADFSGGFSGNDASATEALQNESSLKDLIAQLLNTQGKENAEQSNGSLKSSDVDSGTEMTPEESLVLSLITDELNNSQSSSLTDIVAQAQDALSEISSDVTRVATSNKETNASVGGANTSSPTAGGGESALSQTEFAQSKVPDDLLSVISELLPQSAQKATEAFAERMVSAMPSGQQQQTVKANIIAGINEFQQQVQQGREPGIDLSAIVADAAKEAAVSSEVVASMTSRVDNQASQFLNLMTQTQASTQHAVASLSNQVETVMQENNQLRTEASKSQQQFEGFDKAVNIHKPEGQQQLNEKIRWMVNARNTMAEIRLDPPELGSMQVRVNVAGDAASVSFVVQSQQAKDALADAMPKLRDMLSEQGIELGDAQVRKDNSSGENGQQLAGNNRQGQGDGNRGNNDGLDDMDGTRVIEQPVTRAAKGGIDFYA